MHFSQLRIGPPTALVALESGCITPIYDGRDEVAIEFGLWLPDGSTRKHVFLVRRVIISVRQFG